MKSNFALVSIAACAMMGLGAVTMAAPKDKVDHGKSEYMEKCALCHGAGGKGDGGVMDLLKKAPSDLTTLSKRNGGVFPFDYVYGVIDGREAIKAHGDRDMPIWGKAYSTENVKAAEHFFDVPYDMEMFVRARILALIDYLNRIQSK